jgi:hypothetical protein
MTAAGTPDRPDRKGPRVMPDRLEWEDPKGRSPTTEEVTRSYVEMQLVGAGFTDVQAERLVDGGADWHRAVDLLRAGCPADSVLFLLT